MIPTEKTIISKDERRHLLGPSFYEHESGKLFIRIPGDSVSVVDRPAREADKIAYAAAWEAYQRGEKLAHVEPELGSAGRRVAGPEFVEEGGVLLISIPADSSTIVKRKAGEADKIRFADAWARFSGEPGDASIEGAAVPAPPVRNKGGRPRKNASPA